MLQDGSIAHCMYLLLTFTRKRGTMSTLMMSTDSVDMEVDSNEVSIREEIYDCTIDEGIDISRETTLKKQKEACLQLFERWSAADQTEFVEQLISRMGFHQHEHINSYLVPMLQRDFITALPSKYKWCQVLKLFEMVKRRNAKDFTLI